ncbi:hypothetical protein L6R29_21815 [Myxococcota bacterium]|nr:hypothetical protein [Myxococcota bacterium]
MTHATPPHLSVPKITIPIAEKRNSPHQRNYYEERERMYQWGSLALSLRQDRHDLPTLRRALLLHRETILQLRKTPPLGLFLDLLGILQRGEQISLRTIDHEDPSLQRALRRQQNDLLWRILRCHRFFRIQHLLQQLPTTPTTKKTSEISDPLSLREQAHVYLLAQWLHLIQDLLFETFPPHTLPDAFPPYPPPLWWQHPEEALQIFDLALAEPGWSLKQAHAIFDRFVQIPEEILFPDSVFLILQHIELMPSKLERVRWQQLSEIYTALPPLQTHQQLIRIRDLGYAQMLLPSPSEIPEGGINGLTHQGKIESLLPSELLYWEDSPSAQHIDLFALRWVEQELLFFQREQEFTFTKHRTLSICLDLDLGDARYKAPNAPVPVHALIFGFLARLSNDLRRLCPQEVLSLRYRLGPDTWAEDIALWKLFLTSIDGVGSQTHLSLQPNIQHTILHQRPSSGEFRLLVVTPTTLPPYLHSTLEPPFHALLCFAPAPLHEPSLSPVPHHRLPPTSLQPPLHPPRWLLGFSEQQDIQHTLANLRDLLLASILRISPTRGAAYTPMHRESPP